jgi:hypothetical protein
MGGTMANENVLEELSADQSKVVGFEYCNSQGEIKDVHLIGWRESGCYLLGRCLEDGKFKTYRIDRIKRYFSDVSVVLQNPVQLPPPKLKSSSLDKADGLQVCFTGFTADQKKVFEEQAITAGLAVVQSVTKNLKFLVCGANAGPKKIEQARDRSIYILSSAQFGLLIETGELPDDQVVLVGQRSFAERLDNPSLVFKDWHYKAEEWHWSAFGVSVRQFVVPGSTAVASAWSQMSGVYDFHQGDVFYDAVNQANFLQVAYNSEDGTLEIHEVFGKEPAEGYQVTEEQFAFWLETGIRPNTALRIYRGNSRSGALMWRLSDS